MEEDKYRTRLFDGKNFSDWSFRVLSKIKSRLLEDHVKSPLAVLLEPHEAGRNETAARREEREKARKLVLQQDNECRDLIVERVKDGYLELFKDKETAFEVWKALKDRYETPSTTTRMTLSRELHALTYRPKVQDFQEFCLNFDRVIRELKQAGDQMDNEGAVIKFLLCMPQDYESVISALQTLISSNLSMDFVRVRIEEFEVSRKMKRQDSSAPRSTSAVFLGKRKHEDFPFECNNCGRVGHRKAQCTRVGGGAFRSDQRGRGRGNHQPNPRGRGGYRGGGQTGGQNGGNNYYRGGGGGGRGRGRGWNRGGGATNDNNASSSASANLVTIVTESDEYERPAFCFMMNSEEDSVSTNVWYLDSGASDHLVQGWVPVENRRKLATPRNVQIAKRRIFITAYEMGDVKAQVVVNGKTHDICFNNALIIDHDLPYNLISVSTLEDKGFEVLFSGGKCFVQDRITKVVAADGWREGPLYRLPICVEEPTALAVSSLEVPEATLWHRRLGHIGQQGLSNISNQVKGVTKIKGVVKCCDICALGKQVKRPFQGTRPETSSPLERVHSDLMGPISPVAYDGTKYILLFIDDWSHFTVMFGLKHKSEVSDYIKIYIARVESRFQKGIVKFRCDNGSEFVNDSVKALFDAKGIEFECTITYTPENNGVAEKMNRTVLEKARCMLLGSSLRKTMWIEAVGTAVYLINRSPTKGISDEVVPAQRWYGEKPDLSKLKVFGCVAFMLKPKAHITGKFDSRSERAYMLGYCTNGYRLWLADKGRVVLARNVIFHENVFRFSGDYYETDDGEFGVVNDREEMDVPLNDQNEELVEREINQIPEANDPRPEIPNEGANDFFDVIQEQEDVAPARRSCRIRVRPRHLDDYAMLACMARFADNLAEEQLSVCLVAGNGVSNVSRKEVSEYSAESFLEDSENFSAADYCSNVPQSFEELSNRCDKEVWLEAVREELNSLAENNTWSITNLPSGKTPIKCMWVFTCKSNEEGKVERYKARLVIKGCSQKRGIDYNETYAPVARLATLRVLLSVVNHKNLCVTQLDVKNAFLNGTLKEEIYMIPPKGMHVKPNLVCKLNKTLYGLKQAPIEWNRKFDNFVKTLGYVRCEADRCMYVRRQGNSVSYLLVYVDDIIVAAESQALVNSIKSKLMAEFKTRDLGDLKYFLGIKISRSEGKLYMSQTNYLKNVLIKFGMETCSTVKIPLLLWNSKSKNNNPRLDDSESVLGLEPYRELIGSLMYACMATRPDLCVAVNYYSQFQSNPTRLHWRGLKRILRYIQGTLDYQLCFSSHSKVTLVGYADADFANNFDRKSVSGAIVELFGDAVIWCTRKQITVALSSTEAEFVSLATTTAEVLWAKQLVTEMGIVISSPIIMYEDNQSTIKCLDSWTTKRLKHIDVKYNFVKDLQQAGVIRVMYIQTGDQKADVMTKPLAHDIYEKHIKALGMVTNK